MNNNLDIMRCHLLGGLSIPYTFGTSDSVPFRGPPEVSRKGGALGGAPGFV